MVGEVEVPEVHCDRGGMGGHHRSGEAGKFNSYYSVYGAEKVPEALV